MLRVRGKSGEDAIRASLDRVLVEAERVAKDLGACERKLAAQGAWLDANREHIYWDIRREIWMEGLLDRERLLDAIGSFSRQADTLCEGDPERDVWHMRRVHAPFLGMFWEPGDFLYGEPEQYAPIRR